VAQAQPCARTSLDGLADALPAVAPVPDFVSAMAAADVAFGNLVLIQKHGWEAPPEHPDLVASVEAGILHDALRAARADSTDDLAADDFDLWMQRALSLSLQLEQHLTARATSDSDKIMKLLAQTCTDCHARYRNH
ncbi:MAG: hypothetical protein D6695_03515, partial [Planctomycetota bacterium]